MNATTTETTVAQEAGNKPVTNGLVWQMGQITRDDLKNLRTGLGESYSQFALTLKKAIEPNATRGFSKTYIIQLEQGKRDITPEIQKAYWLIASAHDGVDPLLANAQQVTVWSVNEIAGALVLAKAKECAKPGCKVRFVPTVPWQRFHAAGCRTGKGK